MATLAGEKPSRRVWLGCCCTLTGTVLITLDHSASAVSNHGSPAAASSLGSISAWNFHCMMLTTTVCMPLLVNHQYLTPCLHGIGGDTLILAAAFFYSVVLLFSVVQQSAVTTCKPACYHLHCPYVYHNSACCQCCWWVPACVHSNSSACPVLSTYFAGHDPTRRLCQTLCTCPFSSI